MEEELGGRDKTSQHGMILLSELSRRRIRSIQKLIRIGRNEVVIVLRVDKEKGKQTTPPQIMVGKRGTEKIVC